MPVFEVDPLLLDVEAPSCDAPLALNEARLGATPLPSAVLPADRARRRASEASRPPLTEDSVCVTIGYALPRIRAIHDERHPLRLRVVVVAEQTHVMPWVCAMTRFEFAKNALDRLFAEHGQFPQVPKV